MNTYQIEKAQIISSPPLLNCIYGAEYDTLWKGNRNPSQAENSFYRLQTVPVVPVTLWMS